MMPGIKISMPLPPRLSMDEYMDWVESAFKDRDPVMAARQKDLEERIVNPFRIPGRLSNDHAAVDALAKKGLTHVRVTIAPPDKVSDVREG